LYTFKQTFVLAFSDRMTTAGLYIFASFHLGLKVLQKSQIKLRLMLSLV